MTALSQDDRDFIARHPLDNHLHHLLEPPRAAERSDGTEQDRKNVISLLLVVLIVLQISRRLRSKTSGLDISTELFDHHWRAQDSDFNYDHYRPLTGLVIQAAPDVDIWNAVLDLITTVSRVTPLMSAPATLDITPITHSSASQQGSEQTRELVETRLFEEIRSCTYRDVRGFFQKYFEEKCWTPDTSDIYQAMKNQHKDGKWMDFPNPPMQAKVLDWWFQFQEKFLSKERGTYYTTTRPKDLVGSEARRRIDIFLKPNEGQISDSAHDWKDVRVIGKLKESNRDKKATLLQLSRYVRDVFSHQPTRRYVHAFTICGCEMEAGILDRSGPYSPGSFDIHENPERFIQVIAGYSMVNEEELGLDTFMGREVDGCFVTLEQDDTKSQITVRLDPCSIAHQRAIVCRGASCFLTKTPGSKFDNCVTKFSWTSDQRQPEADLLRAARQKGVKGIANLIAYKRITEIAELRSGLSFGRPHHFRNTSSVTSNLSVIFAVEPFQSSFQVTRQVP